jgi:hypothetical protein
MKFGLITEGASENRIIKHVIARYFRDDEPEINQIQPEVINGVQTGTGGWNEVLKYCGQDEIREDLIRNDYLIIQIDTDQSPTKPFGISHTDDKGRPKPAAELHNEVVRKLSNFIKEDIREKYKNRILFAICIHTIECWLLPVFYTNKHKTGTSNCLPTLNVALRKHDIHIINGANKNKPNGIRSYDSVLKQLKKKEDIEDISQHNIGFHSFINSLKAIR